MDPVSYLSPWQIAMLIKFDRRWEPIAQFARANLPAWHAEYASLVPSFTLSSPLDSDPLVKGNALRRRIGSANGEPRLVMTTNTGISKVTQINSNGGSGHQKPLKAKLQTRSKGVQNQGDNLTVTVKGSDVLDPSQARYMAMRCRELSSSRYYEEVYTTHVTCLARPSESISQDRKIVEPQCLSELSGPSKLFNPPSLAGIALLHNQLSSNIDRYINYINRRINAMSNNGGVMSSGWAIPLRSSVSSIVATEPDLSSTGRTLDLRRACLNSTALREQVLTDIWGYVPHDDRGHLTRDAALKHFYVPILGTLCFDVLGSGDADEARPPTGDASVSRLGSPLRRGRGASARGDNVSMGILPQVLLDAVAKDWYHRTEGHRTLTVSREQFVETMLATVDGWCQTMDAAEASEIVSCFGRLVRASHVADAQKLKSQSLSLVVTSSTSPPKEINGSPRSNIVIRMSPKDSDVASAILTATLGTRNILIPSPETANNVSERAKLPLAASNSSPTDPTKGVTNLTAAIAPASAAFSTGSLAAFVTALAKDDIPAFETTTSLPAMDIKSLVVSESPQTAKPSLPSVKSEPTKERAVHIKDDAIDWGSPLAEHDRGELSVSDEDIDDCALDSTQRPTPEVMAAASMPTPLLPTFESPKPLTEKSRNTGNETEQLLGSSLGAVSPVRLTSKETQAQKVTTESEALEQIVADFERFVPILSEQITSTSSPWVDGTPSSEATMSIDDLFRNEAVVGSTLFKALPEDAGDLSICRSRKIAAKGKRRQSGVSATSQSAISLSREDLLQDPAQGKPQKTSLSVFYPPPTSLVNFLAQNGPLVNDVSHCEGRVGNRAIDQGGASEEGRCVGREVISSDILSRRRYTVPIVRCLQLMRSMTHSHDPSSEVQPPPMVLSDAYIQWVAVDAQRVSTDGILRTLKAIIKALTIFKDHSSCPSLTELLDMYLADLPSEDGAIIIDQESCRVGTQAYWAVHSTVGRHHEHQMEVELTGRSVIDDNLLLFQANFGTLTAIMNDKLYLLYGVLNPTSLWFEYGNEARTGWRPVGTASDLPKRFLKGDNANMLLGVGLEYNLSLAPRSSSSDGSESENKNERRRSPSRLPTKSKALAPLASLRPKGAFNSMLNPAKQSDRRKLVDVAANLNRLDAMGENKATTRGSSEFISAVQKQCGLELLKAIFKESPNTRSPRPDSLTESKSRLALVTETSAIRSPPKTSRTTGYRNRHQVSGFALPEGTHVHGVPSDRVQHTVQITVLDNEVQRSFTAPNMLLFSRSGLTNGTTHNSPAAVTLREASAVTDMISTDEARTFMLKGSERTYSRFNAERNVSTYIAHKLIPNMIARAHHEEYHMSTLTCLPIRGSILIISPVNEGDLAVRSDAFTVMSEDGSGGDVCRSRQGHDPRQTILVHRLERRGKEVPAKLRQPTGPDAELVLVSGKLDPPPLLFPSDMAKQITATLISSGKQRHEALLRIPLEALACGIADAQPPLPVESLAKVQLPEIVAEQIECVPPDLSESASTEVPEITATAPQSLAPLRFMNDNFKIRYERERLVSSEPTVTLVEVAQPLLNDKTDNLNLEEEYQQIREDESGGVEGTHWNVRRGRPLSSLSPAFSSKIAPIGSATYSDISNYSTGHAARVAALLTSKKPLQLEPQTQNLSHTASEALTNTSRYIIPVDTKMRRAAERLNQTCDSILRGPAEDDVVRQWREQNHKLARTPTVEKSLLPSIDNPRPARKGTSQSGQWVFGKQKDK